VKEQSHKDEMSAALRGDFARLRDRGVSATLAPRAREIPQPAAAEHDEPEPPATEEKAEKPAAEPGFFARMLGR
jgi:hypothetical protein